MINVKHPADTSGFEPVALTNARGVEEHPRSQQLRDSFQLLSPADLSALIDVDERTLAVWRTQRPPRGPDFVKLGRNVFYRRADILAWIELNVIPTDRAA